MGGRRLTAFRTGLSLFSHGCTIATNSFQIPFDGVPRRRLFHRTYLLRGFIVSLISSLSLPLVLCDIVSFA